MSAYRIQSGDTLGQIARRFNTSVQSIAQANNIRNPNVIQAGRPLQIPDGFDGQGRPGPLRSASTGRSVTRMDGHDHAGHTHAEGRTTSSSTSRSGDLRAGGGWGGSERVADAARAIAREMGVPVTSQKRDLAATRRVGSTTRSDHYTGNRNAYAADFGVSGRRGDQLARSIARRYGIPESHIGTFNRHTVNIDGQRYSLQLLWRVRGHHDHVHLGIRRA